MITQQIKQQISQALKNLGFGSGVEIHLEHPANLDHGDYSTNIALILHQQIGETEKNYQNPLSLAQAISDVILKKVQDDQVISKVEVAPPGFINFYVKSQWLLNQVIQSLTQGNAYGGSDQGKGKTVIIDYSSPNIAKRFSIGHLRSTVIGQALYNIYRFLGWRVIGDNHLGDWGTQFGKLLAWITVKGLSQEVLEHRITIDQLEQLYIDFHAAAEKDDTLNDLGREWFRKLESGDQPALTLWQALVDISANEFQKIYRLLGVNFDHAYGESFYQDKMLEVIKKAVDLGVVNKSQGALVVDFDRYRLPSNILVKSNGSTTYLARDLALMNFRKTQWHPDLQIFEVGADQKLYFKQVFALAEMMGLFSLNQLKHVPHGMIRLPEGKMSTRKGRTVKLEAVLSEAISRANTLIQEKNSDLADKDRVAKMVGIGAVKYNDLSRDPEKDYIFTWKETLSMQGNSGPYIQYTYARAASVLSKAPSVDLKMFSRQVSRDTIQPLSVDETRLLRLIYRFPEIVLKAAKDYAPHLICLYIFALAQAFNTFYHAHSILGSKSRPVSEETRVFRLTLTGAVAQVLRNGLYLLGIEAPEEM